MNKRQFLEKRQAAWKRFEGMVDFFGARVVKGKPVDKPKDEDDEGPPQHGIGEFSKLFREISNDLATVRSRGWGEGLAGYLNDLLARAYNCFYSAPPTNWHLVVKYLTVDFPKLFRANAGYFLTAALLFFVPLGLAWVTVQRDPEVAERILPGQMLEGMKRMYSDKKASSESETAEADPESSEKKESESDDEDDDSSKDSFARRFGEERSMMFGFYIRNNVGIAFRVFALGVLLGVGTVYVLLYNGIVIGTVAGYVCAQASPEKFLTFVFSHGSFELTAIAVSGGAGLMLGNALIHPGKRDRFEALAVRAIDAIQIALGAGVMLVIAALIEAYWSPSGLPWVVKIGGGTLMWLSVFLYLGLAGRGR